MKIKYVFKYDKKGFLYKYVEKTSGGKVINFYNFNYNKNVLTKYDQKQKIKILIEFYEPCKLSCDSTSMFLPKIKKNFAINEENQIISFNVNKGLLKNWNSIN